VEGLGGMRNLTLVVLPNPGIEYDAAKVKSMTETFLDILYSGQFKNNPNAPSVNVLTQKQFEANRGKYQNDYIAVMGQAKDVQSYYLRKGNSGLSDPDYLAGDLTENINNASFGGGMIPGISNIEGRGMGLCGPSIKTFCSDADGYGRAFGFTNEVRIAMVLIHEFGHNLGCRHVLNKYEKSFMLDRKFFDGNVGFDGHWEQGYLIAPTPQNLFGNGGITTANMIYPHWFGQYFLPQNNQSQLQLFKQNFFAPTH
jgi:hypothetical protein